MPAADVIEKTDEDIVIEVGDLGEDFAQDCACAAGDDNPF
jgi:hypothetical protein